ncbi:hypothetical protein [uncultured Campylobacter sp.]|uniref:hypothetical protein n=1 Tax=uncultured Campylobacter sp. TaxID=218934 RepID=UPI0026198414|nr:hypothetical protein [uncultured Campylobacter sp.]
MRNEMYSRLNGGACCCYQTRSSAVYRNRNMLCRRKRAKRLHKIVSGTVSAALILQCRISRPQNFKVKFRSKMEFYRANSARACKFNLVPISKF